MWTKIFNQYSPVGEETTCSLGNTFGKDTSGSQRLTSHKAAISDKLADEYLSVSVALQFISTVFVYNFLELG